jgi:hypothetical protein
MAKILFRKSPFREGIAQIGGRVSGGHPAGYWRDRIKKERWPVRLAYAGGDPLRRALSVANRTINNMITSGGRPGAALPGACRKGRCKADLSSNQTRTVSSTTRVATEPAR